MDIERFKALCHGEERPPREMAVLLRALWLDARGQWDEAHGLAQEVHTRDGSWVHAYLHRKEGDPYNAGYWYRQAARPACTASLEEEWGELARHLLAV